MVMKNVTLSLRVNTLTFLAGLLHYSTTTILIIQYDKRFIIKLMHVCNKYVEGWTISETDDLSHVNILWAFFVADIMLTFHSLYW